MKLSPAQQRGLAWCAWVTGSGEIADCPPTPTRATMRALAARELVSYRTEARYRRTATGHVPRRPTWDYAAVQVLPAGQDVLSGATP